MHVVLREKASTEDCLEATFHAHLLLHLLSSKQKGDLLSLRNHITLARDSNNHNGRMHKKANKPSLHKADWMDVLAESRAMENLLYQEFRQQSLSLGWKLHETMLNPKDSRLLGAL